MNQSDLDNIAYNMFTNGDITLSEYLKYQNRDKTMTRQDELNEAWCKYMGKCSTEIIQALAFALRWCDEHPHWISVEEEGLPTKDGCYLFCAEGEPVYMCYYYADFKMSRASHWMPLPKMPVLSNSENIGKDLKGGEQ